SDEFAWRTGDRAHGLTYRSPPHTFSKGLHIMRTNARTAATRDEAITAAALLLSDKLPHWTESDYVRGICEVIADTFGADVDDHDQAKDAVWSEIALAPLPPLPSPTRPY